MCNIVIEIIKKWNKSQILIFAVSSLSGSVKNLVTELKNGKNVALKLPSAFSI